MFGTIRAAASARRARRLYELQRLESLLADAQRETDRIERERLAPCPMCAAVKTAEASR